MGVVEVAIVLLLISWVIVVVVSFKQDAAERKLQLKKMQSLRDEFAKAYAKNRETDV